MQFLCMPEYNFILLFQVHNYFYLNNTLKLCEIIMFSFLTDHFLIRASAALEKLKLLCGEEKECSNPSNLLELYTQVFKQMQP